MTISTSVIAEDRAQADGRRWIVEHHTDHLGAVHVAQYLAAAGFDAAAAMAARVADIEAGLAAREANAYVRAALRDEDLIGIVPEHDTKFNVWKRLIKEYRRRDLRYGFKILPLLTHINATYTDQQIRNFLDITQARLNAIRARAAGLAALKPDVEADDALVEDI